MVTINTMKIIIFKTIEVVRLFSTKYQLEILLLF